jgi:hypothetical protein
MQVFQVVQHRLKILRQGRFPVERFAGAGMGYPQAPGVEELAVHQGLNTLSPSAKGKLLRLAFLFH